MAGIVVSDTGPLISLEKMKDGYDFIRKLCFKIIVPPSVLEELYIGSFSTAEEYLQAYSVKDLIEVQVPSVIPEILNSNLRLHQPEKEALALALELQKTLWIEEEIGRNMAIVHGLEISGIAGQVLKANKENLIDKEEAGQKFRELFNGRRLNRRFYEVLLEKIK
jgi:predicted nucleic acid-binding protein